MSLLIDIADAVVARLTAGDFDVAPTVVRRLTADIRKEDANDYLLQVVGISDERSPTGARDVTRHDVRVDVALRKQCDKNDDDAAEELATFIGEVADWLLDEALAADHPADDCTLANETPTYDHERLKNDGLFVGVVTLNYVRFVDRIPREPVTYLDLGNDDNLNLGNGDLLALTG